MRGAGLNRCVLFTSNALIVGLYHCVLLTSNVRVIQDKFKVILQPTVSRPVRLGVRLPSGTSDQFFPFSLQLFLDSYGFVDVGRPL
jgi:hypothetical protein